MQRALHFDHVDPILLGFCHEFHIGNHMGRYSTVFTGCNVVEFSGPGSIHDGNALGLHAQGHDGGKTNPAVGVSHHLGGDVILERSDDNVFLIHFHIEIQRVVADDIHHGVGRLGAHSVGNGNGLEVGVGHLGSIDVQLESLGERNAHRGIVTEGEDNLVVQHLDVGEDTVLKGGATGGHRTQVHGILTVDGNPEVTFVVDGEDRGLVHGDILVINHDGNAVDGPYQLACAVLDHTQHGTFIVCLGSDFKVLYVTAGIGNGNADGLACVGVYILLNLGNEHTLANGRLESLDIGLKGSDTGIQAADELSEARIVVLLGAANQKQRHGNTCQNLFHKRLYF